MPATPEMEGLYSHYYARKKPKNPLPLEKFVRVVELARTGRFTPGHVASMVPQVSEQQVYRIASKTGGRLSNARGIYRDHDLVQQYFYMRRIMGAPQTVAERDLGISVASASRLDRKLFSRTLTKKMRSRNTAAGLGHPERNLMRELLKTKNPDGTYRFSMSMIARAFNVDKIAIVGANKAWPPIRTPQEITASAQKFRAIQAGKYQELYSEVLNRIRAMRLQEFRQAPPKNPLRLTPQEKGELEAIIVRQIERIGDIRPTEREQKNVNKRIETAKQAFQLVFHTPGLSMRKEELAQKLQVDEQKLREAMELISDGQGIGIIKMVRGHIALNPDTTYYLKPPNNNGRK